MKGLVSKKIIALLISAAVVGGGIYVGTTYSSAMTLDEAKSVASNFVPESAELVENENEGGKFELSYRDANEGKTYNILISKKNKAVEEFSVSNDVSEGGASVVFSEDQVKEIIKNKYKGVTDVKVKLEKDGGLYCYEVTFKALDFKGEAEVNAETGVIAECTIKFGKAVTEPIEEEDNDEEDNDSSDSQAENVKIISQDEAIAIVLAKLPGATIDKIMLDKDNTSQEYEGQATLGDHEYDFEINAASGVITNWEKDLKENPNPNENEAEATAVENDANETDSEDEMEDEAQ